MAVERQVEIRGLRLAYVDFGGSGRPLLALHGHFGRARMFASLAGMLASGHRVVSLELRGHGHSSRGGSYKPDEYREDVAEFVREMGLAPVDLLGHSMGGVVAFRVAARYPELVRALVVEEGGACNRRPEVPNPVLDVRSWPRRAPTLSDLRRQIEARGIPDASYFMESAAEFDDGWGFLFDLDDMMESQEALVGDWWPDWLASTCPALLIHGRDSFVLPTPMAREMAARRPGTGLQEFPGCGHWVHDDAPERFAEVVGTWLGGNSG
ncbi:alpha/beta hydrolase [Actinomadura sp. NBRC 104412]|uniref:alpha/beta fold hydrolase n=1 Tax=Actinomadura sp. NBRC 104412 TaxID=3032203 RepID=UPI0024A4F617|nr:alpha/beta hydrolase [Actinomadura sp. NBRC 104412]GLZ05015.1 alpha/beta hydrolase [Actinomadura sp. NBRC 104412]